MSQELARRASSVTIENARLFFKNFSGEETQFNEAGKRNFGVALPADVAEEMLKDGWNVKVLKSRDEGDEPQPWVKVNVSYKNRPPRVVMIAERYNHATQEFERVRTQIPEELVGMLDFADMANVDLTINPYTYDVQGRRGVSAYLGAIYVTVKMDALERKYASVPEVDFNSGEMLQIEGPGGYEEEVVEGELIEDGDER